MSIELYLGDCLEIMKNLPDKSIDLFLCDLPYGCLAHETRTVANPTNQHRKEYSPTERKGCSWDVKLNLEEFWKQVKRLAKTANTPVLHFCTTKFGNELINSNPSWFRYDLVWDKQRGVSFLSANKMPLRAHEMVYVFAKSGAYYNRIDEKGTFTGWSAKEDKVNKHSTAFASGMPNGWKAVGNDGTHRCVKSVVTLKKRNTQGHPTEKPIDLYKWLIERYCPPGGTVLDPTAGSGNVGFACWDLDRQCILIEKDAGFHKKISDKLDTLV
jgi:DNA modification methylase